MLYRNMLAMETEELLRSYPVDGAVLLGGCDKSTPALLMGAASVDLLGRLRTGRADAAGALAQRSARFRYRHVEVLGRQAGRTHRRLRDGRAGERARPLARPLHDDGHRLDPHRRRRGARRHRPRRLLHPGRRLRSRPDGRAVGPPDRRTGVAAAEAVVDPHRGRVRGRRRHRPRARRLHQRRHPSDRDGGPLRHQAHPRRLRPHRPHRARAGQPAARREVPHGGLPLRRMDCPGSWPG